MNSKKLMNNNTETFIRIYCYTYRSMRQKVTISLDSEIAEKLRLQSIKKYGNSRSMSRLIEDLATGAAEAEQPEACSILGHRTERSFVEEKEFQKIVEKAVAHLKAMNLKYKREDGMIWTPRGPEEYFALKEACELELNRIADLVNECWSCNMLNGPLPKFPDAGRNFENFAKMDVNLR